MLNKILLCGTALFVSGTVFAFGGGGSNRTQQYYGAGVDAIGIHRNTNGEQGEIDFDDTCSAEEHKEYNDQGVCVCEDGYRQEETECVPVSPEPEPTCDADHLSLCTTSETCEDTAGGHWCATADSCLADLTDCPCPEGYERDGDNCVETADCTTYYPFETGVETEFCCENGSHPYCTYFDYSNNVCDTMECCSTSEFNNAAYGSSGGLCCTSGYVYCHSYNATSMGGGCEDADCCATQNFHSAVDTIETGVCCGEDEVPYTEFAGSPTWACCPTENYDTSTGECHLPERAYRWSISDYGTPSYEEVDCTENVLSLADEDIEINDSLIYNDTSVPLDELKLCCEEGAVLAWAPAYSAGMYPICAKPEELQSLDLYDSGDPVYKDIYCSNGLKPCYYYYGYEEGLCYIEPQLGGPSHGVDLACCSPEELISCDGYAAVFDKNSCPEECRGHYCCNDD